MPRDAVAVSLGGSFFVQDSGVDTAFARDVAALLRRVAETRQIFAVVGGGAVARRYVEAARALGADEASLDDLGILVTRANARVLIAALGGSAYHRPAETFDEALLAAAGHFPVVVLGGTHAGHTTDAVTAMIAERAKAKRLVIATNVDGVYDSDPRKNPQAKRLPRLTAADLVRITFTGVGEAGSAGVIDPLGARLVARSRIPTAVVKGTDLKALEAALAGRDDFDGSLVVHEGR